MLHFNSAAAGLAGRQDRAARPARSTNILTAADDPAIIAFTSGTTGRAKGTVHFHRDILSVTDTYGRHVLRPQPDDIFIGSPPLSFTYALGGLVLFPMRFGASTALLEHASPPQLLEGIEKYRATVTVTSPTGYRAMLKQAGEFDLTSLRRCMSAGETLPAAVFNAWEKATGIRLMDGIGSTELLHVFIGCTAEDARPGSTGRVVPGYRAIVVDDAGAEVPRGTVGRLAVSGPTGCRYLDDLENQKKYVQQGWNLTGDAYSMDEDGYFWYQARTDDMIVSSGYNISGAEVENVLLTDPSVAECAVVGVPDEARGQLVKAFVVLAPGRHRFGCAGEGTSGLREVATRALQIPARDPVRDGAAPYADREGAAIPSPGGSDKPLRFVRPRVPGLRFTNPTAGPVLLAMPTPSAPPDVWSSSPGRWAGTRRPRSSTATSFLTRCVRRSRTSSPRSLPPALVPIRSHVSSGTSPTGTST